MSGIEKTTSGTIPVRVTEDRPKRDPRKPRRRLAPDGDGLRYDKVHKVEIQGMQVSLPWLSFMARDPR